MADVVANSGIRVDGIRPLARVVVENEGAVEGDGLLEISEWS